MMSLDIVVKNRSTPRFHKAKFPYVPLPHNRYYYVYGEYQIDDAEHTIWVGNSSREQDLKSFNFTLKKQKCQTSDKDHVKSR